MARRLSAIDSHSVMCVCGMCTRPEGLLNIGTFGPKYTYTHMDPWGLRVMPKAAPGGSGLQT